MRKVTIKRNTDGDTRVAKAVPNFYNFKKSNEQHRDDVRKMMREIADDIIVAGSYHDHTKTDADTGSLFYRELCDTIEGQMNSSPFPSRVQPRIPRRNGEVNNG